MKIYYDNSQNGEIIFGISFIVVFFIVMISNNAPIYYYPLLILIPLTIFIIPYFEKRKYYIKKDNDIIEFTLRNNDKYKVDTLKYNINYSDFIIVTYFNKILSIETEENKYMIMPFYDKSNKLYDIFENIEYE